MMSYTIYNLCLYFFVDFFLFFSFSYSCTLFFCFFFSSRRRHTRCGRDWSSDVCSSDLVSKPEPPPGSQICLGFDGSDTDDWTAIRAETFDGWRFTPRYGPDRRPTIWNPADWGGQIPRAEVRAAGDDGDRQYRVGVGARG